MSVETWVAKMVGVTVDSTAALLAVLKAASSDALSVVTMVGRLVASKVDHLVDQTVAMTVGKKAVERAELSVAVTVERKADWTAARTVDWMVHL